MFIKDVTLIPLSFFLLENLFQIPESSLPEEIPDVVKGSTMVNLFSLLHISGSLSPITLVHSMNKRSLARMEGTSFHGILTLNQTLCLVFDYYIYTLPVSQSREGIFHLNIIIHRCETSGKRGRQVENDNRNQVLSWC